MRREMHKKILVVDDDHFILTMLQEILSRYGYKVDTLSKPDKVFAKINEYHPDLILMDIMMAGMDGRIICKAIKASKEMPRIPVILISGSDNVESCVNAVGGPDDFLQKPFDFKFLMSKIEHQLAA